MKGDIKNVAASIRAKLQNKAKEGNRPFAEVLQYYAMERFLYRFSQSLYRDKFILKGALMFTVWDVPERRATLDIDFLARYDNQIIAIEKVIKDICMVDVPADGLIFDPKTVIGQKIKEDSDYEGVRIKFLGFLERSRVTMQIDMGFGDIIYPNPRVIDYPVILDFPKPHLKGYTLESVVAEKFESMIKLGLLNSRMKDYYDLWVMTRRFDFKGENLAEALKITFRHRKTPLPKQSPLFDEEIYDSKSDRQILWRAFLTKGQVKQVPEKLSVVAKTIEKFLIKPLIASSISGKFFEKWHAPGPWK